MSGSRFCEWLSYASRPFLLLTTPFCCMWYCTDNWQELNCFYSGFKPCLWIVCVAEILFFDEFAFAIISRKTFSWYKSYFETREYEEVVKKGAVRYSYLILRVADCSRVIYRYLNILKVISIGLTFNVEFCSFWKITPVPLKVKIPTSYFFKAWTWYNIYM